MNIVYRFLNEEEYYLADQFFEDQQVPKLDPKWSKVIAAIDMDIPKVVGIMCLQLVAHAEPIMIEKEYREQGIWREMAEMMDGYLFASGVPGVYTQPTNPTAKALTEKMGFEESKHPLCVKIYDSLYTDLVPVEKEG